MSRAYRSGRRFVEAVPEEETERQVHEDAERQCEGPVRPEPDAGQGQPGRHGLFGDEDEDRGGERVDELLVGVVHGVHHRGHGQLAGVRRAYISTFIGHSMYAIILITNDTSEVAV